MVTRRITHGADATGGPIEGCDDLVVGVRHEHPSFLVGGDLLEQLPVVELAEVLAVAVALLALVALALALLLPAVLLVVALLLLISDELLELLRHSLQVIVAGRRAATRHNLRLGHGDQEPFHRRWIVEAGAGVGVTLGAPLVVHILLRCVVRAPASGAPASRASRHRKCVKNLPRERRV